LLSIIWNTTSRTLRARFTVRRGRGGGFSYDGSGDFVSTMTARCEGTEIEVLDRVYLPHSLGSFYTMICDFIGIVNTATKVK